jgi:hypothetical protein
MLFGTFHLMHRVGDSAVSIYEKDYPNVTFVISDLLMFDAEFAPWIQQSIRNLADPVACSGQGHVAGCLRFSSLRPPSHDDRR